MEHSKLPLKYDGVSQIIDCHGDVFMWTEDFDSDEIELIVTACNEHDTLQAKAGLLDGLVSYCTSDSAGISNSSWERQVLSKLKSTISKAKEVSK
jgi:hypothetical protein